MGHIEGTSRVQQVLFPEVLDDSMVAENPVEFIAALVDSLDLDAFGWRRTQPAAMSCSSGDRRKLYIYGDRKRIRSSRRLVQETHRSVEPLWLLRKLPPTSKQVRILGLLPPVCVRDISSDEFWLTGKVPISVTSRRPET
jgi:transposase